MVKKSRQHRIEYLALRMVETAFRWIPALILPPLARGLAWFFFNVVGFRKKIALKNLALAFPEKPEKERRQIARDSFFHLIIVTMEYLKLLAWPPERIEGIVSLRDSHAYRELLTTRPEKGRMMLTGHFGSWEVAAAYAAQVSPATTYAVQKRQKNSLVDEHVADWRRRYGLKIIYAKGAVRRVWRALNERAITGLLIDQDGGRQGVFVPFFGVPASTMVGAAVVYLKTEVPVYFFACIRTGTMRYELIFDPVPLPEGLDTATENVAAVSEKMTAVLEKHIREHPDQYLWIHKRWKTRPQ
ncbi:MAG TPA: lysophospholipid acyltransferase family protein [Calditrichia bacterium]|nr:lysophospholipid acyltransferase family protein [Calditrichia bacterium]